MNKKKLHRGELLKHVVDESGVKLQKILTNAGYHRSTYYTHIQKDDLSLDILYKYGKAIPYDFSLQFPELASYETESVGPVDYNIMSQKEVVRYLKEWREKYYIILEENHELRLKNDQLQEMLLQKDEK